MKHSDLKVGMKVKRVNNFNKYEVASSGKNVTVEYIDHDMFSIEEDNHGVVWDAHYFEPVEETKEKETMNTESNLISMDKKYKTRCGYPVRILCVDRKDALPVLFLYTHNDSETACSASSTGKVDWNDTDYDLIEVSPYEDFKKGDKVMVRDYEDFTWNKRYFAYEKAGKVYCFENGRDSWASDNQVTPWKYCRKPTQEELGE